MEHGACNIIYLDRKAGEELVKRESLVQGRSNSVGGDGNEYFQPGGSPELQANIETILTTFNEVYVCKSGGSCLSRVATLQETPKENIPTIVLLDIPYDEDQKLTRSSRELRTPSPTSTRSTRLTTDESVEAGDIYGMRLLTHIYSAKQSSTMSRLIIPVVVLSGFERDWASSNLPSPSVHGSQVLQDTVRLTRYLDAGATDVVTSPLSKDHVQGLAIHAYRVYKEVSNSESSFLAQKRNRKLSWVGVDDTKPYAYLREAMVSNLMGHICNPETVGEEHNASELDISAERSAAIAESIGTWAFSAHDFDSDELVYAALLMLQHALDVPELEKWRMSTADLITFLQACRHAYNDFVLYHNFRHVVDVLQASFFFLVQIGTLQHYPKTSTRRASPPSAIASLLKPFDALTLLVSAIGHDVGHPGVNNAFLVALNAPLAQLYNDRSVLESFHCAAYSQILRRYWPSAFEEMGMRKLMINSILATDMGLHFDYMSNLGNLQEKLAHNNNTLDGWNLKILAEYRDLACGLLIKCADISNVARKFNVAAQWASILTDEFSNQGNMEKELNIPTQLFGGPPVLDSVIKMGESQIGFINIFARPLFEAVTHILPAMQFSVDEILTNKSVWEKKIEQEKNCGNHNHTDGGVCAVQSFDGLTSPLSDSPSSPLSGSHVELPGTKPLSTSLSADVQDAEVHSAEVQEGGGAGVATFLGNKSSGGPRSPVDRKKKDKSRTSRLRSLSPTKRKAKSRDRSSSQKQESSRPRTSPPVPSSHDISGNGTPYSLMNGHAVGSSEAKIEGGNDGAVDTNAAFMQQQSQSTTDVSFNGKEKNRMSKFGLGKLWKKRWRIASASSSPPNSRSPLNMSAPAEAEETAQSDAQTRGVGG